jgi:arylsulfatase
MLLTGRAAGSAQVRDNVELQPEGQKPLAAGTPNLARSLQAAGYATGLYGKWGLGPVGSSGDPNAQGFDQFYGYACQRHAHSHTPEWLWRNQTREPLPPGTYAPDRFRDEALAFLRTRGERPFFVMYATTIPHMAMQVPEDSLAQYAGAFPETPYTGGRGYTPHPTPRAAYAAMITRMDREVGELLDLLDELSLSNDTIVVFTSDNGATHSPVGGTDVDFFASCGELRGRKGSMYEGGIRVPTIVRYPGVVPAGTESDFVSGFEDWLPTLTELTGTKNPIRGDGVSLAETLRGKKQTPRPFLYREFAGYGGWQAVWVGDHKLVRKDLQKNKPATELYDLRKDASESNDLLAKEPKLAERMQRILDREHVPSDTFKLKAIDTK